MTRAAITDTGPLVALLDRDEEHHRWSEECLRELAIPLLVCEPVLAEAMYLLSDHPAGQDEVYRWLHVGALRIALRMDENLPALRALQKKYRDRPMSLADACVVRMSELYDRHSVFTLDSDFRIYRKNGRQPMDLISPRG